jgi:membrane-associated phospholipid phosphatase
MPVSQYSQSYRVLQPSAFVNQYAAMPSLHVGWDALIGIAIAGQARVVLFRWFGALLPVAMVFAVVLTANHYLLDVVAGLVLVLASRALVIRFTARRAGAPARRLSHLPPPADPTGREPSEEPADIRAA